MKIVRVFHYPVEDLDEELNRVSSAYGQVYAIQRESVPGFPETFSGTRPVQVEMVKDILNLVKIHDRCEVRCEYEGVVRHCICCSGTGHYAAACTSPKCKQCEQFGHKDCDAPFAVCQANHERSACRFRLLARVVGQTSNSSAAVAIEETFPASKPEVASTEQDTSGTAQKSSAETLDALNSTTPEEEARTPEEAIGRAGAAAITEVPVKAAVGEAAAVAPPLAVAGKPSEGAKDAADSVAPSLEIPKKQRRKRSKRKLFAEEKMAGSKTGLHKASDSDDASTRNRAQPHSAEASS